MPTTAIQPKKLKYTFDAQGEKPGRFASKVAIYLRGKMETNFTNNILPSVYVTIKNIDKFSISDKKMTTHVVTKYTGYHGGLKTKLWNVSYTQNPQAFFMRIMRYMLPKNRQSAKLLKHLKFE